mgnify:CR=1 FL=1
MAEEEVKQRFQFKNVEVLNGLKSNMLLIEEGARSVKEGQEVEIINQ